MSRIVAQQDFDVQRLFYMNDISEFGNIYYLFMLSMSKPNKFHDEMIYTSNLPY